MQKPEYSNGNDTNHISNGEESSALSQQNHYSKYGIDPHGWFTETDAMWPGQKFSLALDGFAPDSSVVHASQSDFQSILVFRSAQYGHVLVLDGVIQMTERDEFAYHEMMCHLALCSIRHAPHILLVGGGDGGILKQLLKHYDDILSITVVEIDPAVIQVACQYLGAAEAFADPRVTVVTADAAEFLANPPPQRYQVIISDTSDPVGPAASLFSPAFYESMYHALDEHEGLACTQAECLWIHLDLIADLIAGCRDMFDTAEYATTLVPTYPCGQIGFVLARKGAVRRSAKRPVRAVPRHKEDLRYYSSAMHEASFCLPRFVEEKLEDDRHTEQTDCALSRCTIQ